MKSILSYCLVVLSLNMAYSQGTSHEITSVEIRKKKLKVYSDSLVMFKTTQQLPIFLFSKNFDIEKSDIPLKNNHNSESLRMAVLSNIYDVKLLHEIATAILKNKNYSKIKPDNKSIPFANYTFYDLILIRIEELKND